MALKIADTSGQDVALAPRGNARRWYLAGAALVVGSVLIWWVSPRISQWSEAEVSVAKDRVRIASATMGDLLKDVSVQGRVVAGVSPTLYASQPGTVTFSVAAGDSVQRAQLLASIDSPEVTNQLQQEQSSLARLRVELDRQRIQVKQQKLADEKAVDLANVQLTARDREARRAQNAHAKKAISDIDYEKARDELLEAQLAHKHAVADAGLTAERLEFELRTRQLEIDRQGLLVQDLVRQVAELAIHSPVSGVVGNLLVADKSSVTRNQAVLSVVDLTQFEVEADVPESYADDLGIGMAAEVLIGDRMAPATLVSVSPEIINNQVTCRLRFGADPPNGLRQNQRLTTRILLEEKRGVLTVPRGQFLETGGGRIAYVVEGDVARKRAIEVGAYSISNVEVLSGLKAGDNIVVSGTDLFRSADTVLITN